MAGRCPPAFGDDAAPRTFPQIEHRADREVNLLGGGEDRLEVVPRARHDEPVVEVREVQRSRHSPLRMQVPEDGCQIAHETSKRAPLRHPDQIVALKPYVRRLVVYEQQTGKLLVIGQCMRARKQM
eukprot:1074230-Pyramimonas_sp.AAC.1